MKNFFISLILVCVSLLFMCNGLYANEPLTTPFSEDFEAEDVFETTWTALDVNNDVNVGTYATGGIWLRSTALKHGGNAAASYRFVSNSADDWMFSPAIQLEKGKTYSLKWWDYSSASYDEKYAVYIGTDKIPANQTIIGEDRTLKTGLWNERAETFTVETTGVYHLSWYCHSDKNKATLFIDDITLEEINPIDMKAVEIKGLPEVTVGAECKHRLVVENRGTEVISTFSVSLFDGANNLLATANYNGEEIPNLGKKEIEISWTPTQNMEGEHTIKAVVNAENDPIAANNSATLKLFVYPFATFQVHVADFEETSSFTVLPINLTSYNSGSQVIYYENEINHYGYINSLKYYADFGSSGVPNQEMKVYINVTDREDMDGQWTIDGNTLVFEGTVNFPAGAFESVFNFDEPFLYTGGNLLVTVIRSGDTASGKYFIYSSNVSKPNRSRAAIDYRKPFDFSQTGTLNQHCPNTSFLMHCDGGSVEGTVTSGIDAPVGGVIVKMTCSYEGQTSEYEALTNEAGEYIFKFVPSGNYTITANKAGFIGSDSSVEVSYLSEKTVDFNIESLNKYSIEGKVINQNGDAIANASVILKGEDTFVAITDNEGKFITNDIYGSRIYDIEVMASNYLIYTSEVTINEGNLTLSDIRLTGCTGSQAPQNILRETNEENWYDVTLSWTAPTGSSVAGYKIFRNNTLLNPTELITETTYSETLNIGTYTYKVIAISESNCVSLPAELVVEMQQNPCEIAINTFPYMETFETGSMPSCWEQEFIIGRTPWEVTNENGEKNPDPMHGTYNLKFFTMQKGTITKLITPMMDITELEEPTLDFHLFHINFGPSFDELRVYYRTSADGEWIELKKYINYLSEWKEMSLSLPNPSETYYLAFEARGEYGRGILLDDIKVVDASICATINELSFEQIAERRLELSWYAPHSTGVSSYKLYRDNQLIKTLEAKSYKTVFVDEDVDLGEHKYKVIAVYTGKDGCTESVPVEETFVTIGQCDPISNLKLEQKGANSVALEWTAPNAGNIASYTIIRNGEAIASTKNTEYLDEEAVNGSTDYCVEAIYSGKDCEVSEAVCANIFSICDPVVNLTATFNKDESTIDLKWDINVETTESVAMFNIYRDGELIYTTNQKVYIDWFIELGKSYNYCIVAKYINECVSSSACVDVDTECIAPTGLSVIMSRNENNCSAELNWDFSSKQAYESLPAKETSLGTASKDNLVFADKIQASDMIPTATNHSLYQGIQYSPKEDENNLVYTSGPYITHTGSGYEGNDVSVVEQGFGAFGYTASAEQGLYVGEDFTLEETTHISEMEFFSYLFIEDLPISKITAIHMVIIKGHPFLENGRVVWGDLENNILSETSFTGVYRVPESNHQNPYRAIMNVKAKIDYTLPAGNYWILFTLVANAPKEAGPSMVPVTIPGVQKTGNAIQYSSSGFWREIIDSENLQYTGIAFNVFGSPVADKFNVYRDNNKIASGVEGTTYMDENVPAGAHKWEVTHVCRTGESEPVVAEDTCTPNDIEDIDSGSLAVFPNPTKDMVTVRADKIEKVEVYNLSGVLLKNIIAEGKTEISVDLKGYAAGTYMIVVYSSDKQRETKRILLTD